MKKSVIDQRYRTRIRHNARPKAVVDAAKKHHLDPLTAVQLSVVLVVLIWIILLIVIGNG